MLIVTVMVPSSLTYDIIAGLDGVREAVILERAGAGI